jgi:cell wall-associated NlpC family hydrolase
MREDQGHLITQMLGGWGVKLIDGAVSWIKGNSVKDDLVAATGMPSAMAARVVAIALKQINKPYVFGSHGPNSFDCSGLAEYSYRMAGYPTGKIPGPMGAIGMDTKTEVRHGWDIGGGAPMPADLVFYSSAGVSADWPHHVAIVTKPPQVISAADEAIGIIMSTIGGAGNSGDSHTIRRYIKPEKEAPQTPTGPVPVGAGTGNPSVDRWAATVMQAARMVGVKGWDSSDVVGGILGMIQPESGGNPRAMNDYDVNWQNHIPSVGLMQMITPNLRYYHEPGTSTDGTATELVGPQGHSFIVPAWMVDPLANIAAAMNYMVAGFGSVRAGIKSRLQAGWYDQGGMLMPGTSLVTNMTRKPEPVLTSQQWDNLTSAATAPRGGGVHVVTGGSIDISPDSQGALRAWVQDLILEEADQDGTYMRMGGGNW